MTDTPNPTTPDPFDLGDEQDDTDAQNREFAGIDFEPYPADQLAAMVKDFSEPTYSEMMNDMGARLRMATVILGDTKGGLIKMSREFLDDRNRVEHLFEMMATLQDAADRFKSLHELARNATLRLNCAASVVIVAKH